MPGQLFTQYFLTDGIQHTPEWRASAEQPQAFADFAKAAAECFKAFGRYDDPNESVTEQELIRPVLALDWVHTLPQQGAARGEDIPDHLLFADAEAKARAAGRSGSEARYRDALLIEESKRFGLPLDTREAAGNARSGTPHGQIRRYLSTADHVTDGRLRWGILTNGGVWRLYDYRARPRASGYYEADLAELIQPGNEDALHTFYLLFLLFRRDVFTPQDGARAAEREAVEHPAVEAHVDQKRRMRRVDPQVEELRPDLAGRQGAKMGVPGDEQAPAVQRQGKSQLDLAGVDAEPLDMLVRLLDQQVHRRAAGRPRGPAKPTPKG